MRQKPGAAAMSSLPSPPTPTACSSLALIGIHRCQEGAMPSRRHRARADLSSTDAEGQDNKSSRGKQCPSVPARAECRGRGLVPFVASSGLVPRSCGHKVDKEMEIRQKKEQVPRAYLTLAFNRQFVPKK
ncbi:hypothetical protein PAHAL_2G149900 [Panicum hallii]|uniref:Uncharacterized protein n=1 Tax=Panicum hallii TaxID=206008 RepID=A0A2S3GYE3_9POAL|nr:hypothetical protein PAHAL_2G149900 [Panicum hallii]